MNQSNYLAGFEIRTYRYEGDNVCLYGVTAKGIWCHGEFLVQVCSDSHPWSEGWHACDFSDWEWVRDE